MKNSTKMGEEKKNRVIIVLDKMMILKLGKKPNLVMLLVHKIVTEKKVVNHQVI